MEVRTVPIETVVPYEGNPRKNAAAVGKVAESLREYGWRQPLVVDAEMILIAGHTRLAAAKSLGWSEVPIHVAEGLSAEQVRAYRLADNRTGQDATWDDELLAIEIRELDLAGFDLTLTGFTDDELAALKIEGLDEADPAEGDGEPDRKGNLAARFGVPPFSVLSAREGWWQDRKRAWIAIGIKSELGRGGDLLKQEGQLDRYEAIKAGGRPLAESFADQDKLQAFMQTGRKANAIPGGSKMPLDRAAPGGSKMPAMNYSKTKARGDGRGRPVP